jgi:hypothetical protein
MIPLLTNTPMCKIQQISKHPILTNTLICKNTTNIKTSNIHISVLVNIGCFDIGCILHIGVLVNIGCFDIGCILHIM